MPDYDSPATIIKAVRDWQEAGKRRHEAWIEGDFDAMDMAKLEQDTKLLALRYLRLPPKGEGR